MTQSGDSADYRRESEAKQVVAVPSLDAIRHRDRTYLAPPQQQLPHEFIVPDICIVVRVRLGELDYELRSVLAYVLSY